MAAAGPQAETSQHLAGVQRNGTRALDMVSFFRHATPLQSDLIVLADYPGYGQSEGSPTPDHIRESIKALLPAVAARLQIATDGLHAKLRVFGHSLGCAAALMAMEELGIQQGTLVAPFTSLFDMARQTVGWPLCCLLHHRFDNVATLSTLQARGGCHVDVIHGSADEVIPQSQGRSLAAAFPAIIAFHSAEQARHNNILATHHPLIVATMAAMRQE